ncbi:hypothetical protein [Lentzea sp. NBRC 102530]|uniref:hypothetical protein n=1 Tax=Lentzea sp. NBRC 102530 TaxID=3032201 RepID=UPI002556B792|nr:hypothetical protein [Lentzea sp. NBRC 102530]
MTDEVGTAAGPRVRARVAVVGLVLFSSGLAVFGGWLLGRDVAVGLMIVLLGAMVGQWVVYLAAGRFVELRDGRYLTCRTFTGPRTVDLDRLVEVRRLRLPTTSGEQHWVELVDADGVRLLLNDDSTREEVQRVVAAYASGVPRMARRTAYFFLLLEVVAALALGAVGYLLA